MGELRNLTTDQQKRGFYGLGGAEARNQFVGVLVGGRESGLGRRRCGLPNEQVDQIQISTLQYQQQQQQQIKSIREVHH